MKKILAILLICLISGQFLVSCTSDTKEDHLVYQIEGSKIFHNGVAKQFIGSNAFHSFGVGSSDMNPWNMDVVREFIGNVQQNPITGSPIQDQNGSYLHSLQSIVADNRANHKITILCAFGWKGTTETLFSGKRPTDVYWWVDYKIKLKEWAVHFKNQPDVWIEVWNEPYRYDRLDGYSDSVWENDMNQLVSIIRNENNTNIILVPCAEQGQDESVLINKGAAFLNGKSNILFDVHAYEKWLLDTPIQIENRLQLLKSMSLPVFFGEIAPMNAGVLMNPQFMLNQLYEQKFSICAWVWKYDETDKDALLTNTGQPNDTNNNNWGSVYKEVCLRSRNQ